MPRFWRLIGVVLLLTFAGFALAPKASLAQSVIERLVSPGELSAAHSRSDIRCASCHQSFNRQAQSRQCLTCHRPVAADIAAHTGFHGRSQGIAGAECRSCHAEHHGRATRIVQFNPRAFNHAATDYPLRGAHASVACTSCHAAGSKYRIAPSTCAACHQRQDPHRGSLGANCAQCHNETAWRTVTFDHARTHFALVGAHARVTCSACHADRQYQNAPTRCIACHQARDVHRGRMGPDCASCHTPSGWTPARFDHARTGFPLSGAHAQVTCAACHPGGRYQQARPTCVSCHAGDDAHHVRFGAACADCHTSRDWRVTRFDHGRTGFALTGGHAGVGCAQCHGPSPAREPTRATTCVSCHADDDSHHGRNGPDCQRCHTATNWQTATFDHDRATRFALTGAHARVACAQCHIQPAAEVRPEMACASCHADDDRHAGQLGRDCATCHATASWTADVRFDHALAPFPLLGAHATVTCAACHPTPRFRDAPTACASCHRDDDAHRGAYRGDCGACHTPTSWPQASFDHSRTLFPLGGRHVGVACVSCHAPGRAPATHPRSCADCHQADDPHRGAFGPDCGRCHQTTGFEVSPTSM